MMMKITLPLAVATAVAAASAVSAGPELPEGIAEAQILPGWRQADGTHIAALHLRMEPGWHTYWRAPGEAGIPPQFGWEKSGNLSAATVHWPRPSVFELNGMRTLGYEGDVVLPIRLAPSDGAAPITLDAEIDMGICDEVCVPVSLRVKAALPVQGAENGLILAALQSQPRSGMNVPDCTVEPISDGLRIHAKIDSPKLDESEVAVVELADKTIWVSSAETTRDGDRLTAVADLVPPDGQPFALDRSNVRITVIGAADSVEFMGCEAG